MTSVGHILDNKSGYFSFGSTKVYINTCNYVFTRAPYGPMEHGFDILRLDIIG